MYYTEKKLKCGLPQTTIPITVATGIRKPRIQGTPPIWSGFTVTRVNLITNNAPRLRNCQFLFDLTALDLSSQIVRRSFIKKHYIA
jgi:hypothetical protein